MTTKQKIGLVLGIVIIVLAFALLIMMTVLLCREQVTIGEYVAAGLADAIIMGDCASDLKQRVKKDK